MNQSISNINNARSFRITHKSPSFYDQHFFKFNGHFLKIGKPLSDQEGYLVVDTLSDPNPDTAHPYVYWVFFGSYWTSDLEHRYEGFIVRPVSDLTAGYSVVDGEWKKNE